MEFWSFFCVFLPSCWISISFGYLLEINPQVLEDKLEDFIMYGLRYKDMQAYIDNITFDKIPLKGEDLLESMTEHYEIELGKRIDAIKRLREAAQNSYSETTAHYTQCCEIDPLIVEYDPLFKTSVSTSGACDRVSSSATSSSARLSSSAFQDAALENVNITPTLKWQYFGSKEGVTTIFPTSVPLDCSTYDNRLRPWYAQAAVLHHQQVVIVIDSSGSMAELHQGVRMFDLVTEAAKSIIETLNPYDMFAVVAASDRQKTLSDFSEYGKCFSHDLAHATPSNKKEVNSFIDRIVPKGGTYYVAALERAFTFFKEMGDAAGPSHNRRYGDHDADKSLHFISDGSPNDSPKEILLKFETLHNTSKHRVLMITYGVGSGDFKLLNDLVLVNPDVRKKGEFVHITSTKELRNRMGDNYKLYFEKGVYLTEPIWSVPYLDDFGIGQVTTASLPVYINGSLIGVVAIEVALEDLFAKSTYFSPNEFTYSFITDNTGLLLNHPLLPHHDDRDSLYVYASAFERDKGFGGVFHDMQAGLDGNASFYSTKITTHGDSKAYLVELKRVFARYFWNKINSTTFAICVVTVGDSIEVLPSQEEIQGGTLFYHRFDLVPPEKPCEHLSILSSMDNSALVLAPRAFSDPNYVMNHVMTKTEVEEINEYIEGKGKNTLHIKGGIKDQIAVVHHAQDFWLQPDENSDIQKDIAWRYVATRDGVFHVFPGRLYPINFDATKRPWYEQALAHRDRTISVTYPHLDAGTGLAVVTLSKALFYGNSSGEHDHNTNEVFGVMAADILASHFNALFFNMYPLCKDATQFRCLLIDVAGTVLVTNEIGTDYTLIKELYARHDGETHLTKLEPEMSSVLIGDNVLHKINCSKNEAGLFQRMYRISLDQEGYRGVFKTSFFNAFVFQLSPVANTNVFILVKFLTESTCGMDLFTCPCSSSGCITNGTEEGNCECPCATGNPHYFSCANKYTEDAASPCTPGHSQANDYSVKTIDKTAYPQCYQTAFTREDEPASDNLAVIIPGTITGVLLLFAFALLIYAFPSLTAALQDDEIGNTYKRKQRPLVTSQDTPSTDSFDLHIKDAERLRGKADSREEIHLSPIKSDPDASESSLTTGTHKSNPDKSSLYLPGNAMSFLSNRSIMNLADEANVAGGPSAKEQQKQPTPGSSDEEMPYVHGSTNNSGAPNFSDGSSLSGLNIKSNTNMSTESSYSSLSDFPPPVVPRANSVQPEMIIKELKTRNMSLPGRFSRIPFRAADLTGQNASTPQGPTNKPKNLEVKRTSVEGSGSLKRVTKTLSPNRLNNFQPSSQKSEKKKLILRQPQSTPTRQVMDKLGAKANDFLHQSGSGYEDLYDIVPDWPIPERTVRTTLGPKKQMLKTNINPAINRHHLRSSQDNPLPNSRRKTHSPATSYTHGVNSGKREKQTSLQAEVSQYSAKQSLPFNKPSVSSDEKSKLVNNKKKA